MTPATYLACVMFLPKTFTIIDGSSAENIKAGNADRMYAFYAVVMGVWGGLVIGFITEYYTSYAFNPTKDVAKEMVFNWMVYWKLVVF